jgi:hypothetical protein
MKITVREFRQNLAKYLDLLSKGESVTVGDLVLISQNCERAVYTESSPAPCTPPPKRVHTTTITESQIAEVPVYTDEEEPTPVCDKCKREGKLFPHSEVTETGFENYQICGKCLTKKKK